jgi:inosine-uridine nucleoside N-ribohydrolase
MMFKRIALCLLLGCILGMIAVPAAAATPKPLIIDTDMSTDDWMAILLMMKNPDYKVVAITVTGTGWSYCDAGVKAALGLVALMNYGDVPVSCWEENPLGGEANPVPWAYRTSADSLTKYSFPAGGQPAADDAVTVFSNTVKASTDKVTVLALGPLTNIAQAFSADASLIGNIEMIYVMGGAVDVPGSSVSQTNTTAEWNIYCDPLAARMVFESGAPITLVPLDATNDVQVTMDFLHQLDGNHHTPAADFVDNILNNSTDFIQSGGYYFWDPLAAGVLSNNGLVTLTDRMVTVVDEPGPNYGRTMPVGNGPHIMVATKPDGAAFKTWFMDTLNAQ